MHNWKLEKALRWAVREQLKYLSERFQKAYLEPEDEYGLIVSDSYASRRDEGSILFVSTYTASVMGVRLKLFPANEMKNECAEMLNALDARYIVTNEKGIYLKE